MADGHEGWINIESVSFGLGQKPVTAGASRRRAAVSLDDLVVVKTVDKATPKLMEVCAKGEAIPKLELDMTASNGRVYYKVTLENVMVTSVKTNTVCDPGCQVFEEVAISYSKIKWEYTDDRGGKVESTYDARRGF